MFIEIPLHESGKLMPAHLEGWVEESIVLPLGGRTPFRKQI